MKSIRIASGQGFWGDWLEAPKQQLRRGPIDYLVLDYLAEVTMSILAKQHERDPSLGYAKDFVELTREILPEIVQKKVKVLANAGGVNPKACGEAVLQVARDLGLSHQVKIAVVLGDNILPSIAEHQGSGEEFLNLDNGREITPILDSLRSANVYLGADALVEALEQGADIIITGRVADASLVVAPARHEFAWSADDWDSLASAVVAGHIIECGPQSSGGNFNADWESVPELWDVGYPIIEMWEDATFSVIKHLGTGGLISEQTVKEQLVYEIGDPSAYYGPDVVADFTSLSVSQSGPDRVQVRDVKGRARPERLKVSMSYAEGFMAEGTMVYSWPQAVKKARAAEAIIRKRLESLDLCFEKLHAEILGVNACHGEALSPEPEELAETMLRIAVLDPDRSKVKRFTREIAPLVLSGPPSATGYFGGKSPVKEVLRYWPTLISRDAVQATWEFVH